MYDSQVDIAVETAVRRGRRIKREIWIAYGMNRPGTART